MKTSPKLPILAALAAALILPTTTFAQTTWDGGGGDNNFGTGLNWVGDGTPPTGTTSDLVFAGNTRTNPFNNYNAWDDFRSIFFASGAGTFSITGNAIDLFGKIENNSSSTQTFALELGVNTSFIEINPVSGNLNINSANIFLGANQLRVWGNNGNTLTFGSGTTISGSGGSVAINENSRVIYQSAHTYTGSTFVNAGTLRFNSGGSVNSSTIRLGDTSGSKNATLEVASGVTLGPGTTPGIEIRAGSSGNTLAIANTDSSGTATIQRNITLNNSLTGSAAAGSTLLLSGTLSASGNLTIAGAGTVTLTANNTYTGTTTIGSGSTLSIGDSSSSAGAFGTGNVTNNGTLLYNRNGATWTNLISGTGSLIKEGTAMLQLSNANTYSGGTTIVNGSTGTTNVSIRLQASEALGTGPLTVGTAATGANGARLALNGFNQTVSGLSSGSTGVRVIEANGTTGGATSTLTVNQSSNTSYSGILRDNSSATGVLALVKTGAGTLNLLDAQSLYTGKTTISGGAISIGANSNLPTPGSLVADSLTLSSGGKLVTTASFTSSGNRGITFGTGGGALEVASGQTTTIANDSILNGTGSLAKLGAGTLVITAFQSSTYTGKVIIGEGAISINADSRLGANPGTLTADALTLTNGGKLVTTASFSLGGNRGITLGTGGGVLETDSGTTLTLATVNQLNGSGSLTKAGAGTLAVTRANANNGATIVSGGVLNLNATSGSAAASTTSVTVGTGATLLISANEQVNNSATVTLSGGTIQRGAGVSETFSNLNLTADSILDYGAGAIGTLTFGTYSPVSKLTVNNFLEGNVLRFSSNLSGSINNSSFFAFDNGFTTDWNGSTFTITAIPEPSTVLAALGLAGLMLWPARRMLAGRRKI